MQPQSRPDKSDVALSQRSEARDAVRQRFDDVFQVDEDCESFGEYDIDEVANDFSVHV